MLNAGSHCLQTGQHGVLGRPYRKEETSQLIAREKGKVGTHSGHAHTYAHTVQYLVHYQSTLEVEKQYKRPSRLTFG